MTIYDFFKNDAFALNAGVELMSVELGKAKTRMLITDKHLNGGGVCQGGALFTLADLAFAAATNSHGKLTLSVSADIRFLKAESKGYLYAEAEEIYNHGRMAHCDVRITNDSGDLVATFSSIGYHKDVALPFDL